MIEMYIIEQLAAVPRNKVAVPLLDGEVDVTFCCVCRREAREDFAALFSAIAGGRWG